MMFKKQSKPLPENIPLPSPQTVVEEKPDYRSSPENGLPNGGFFEHERKQIALEESEARYRRLFETAKDGILILDGDYGRITDVNPFLLDLLGYSKTELIGKQLWEIGPVRDIIASKEAMGQLQNADYIRYEDLPLETKTGERKQVEFVSNAYLVNGWRVIQCNIRDISARKHAESFSQIANEKLLALVNELQERDKEMQTLNRLNNLLHSCMTSAEAYQVIALTAGELFPGYNGCLAILDGTDQHLEVVAHWGIEMIMQTAFSWQACWALRRGQLHEVVDPETGLICHHFLHVPEAGYLCLPLMVQGETFGVLSLSSQAIWDGRHQPGLQQLAVTVGETIKLSLSNLKLRDELRQQAVHDPLTGLFNRRYLDETLSRELYMAQRRKAPLSVVVLDIDNFKQFNDSFGHGSGDALLRELGRILREGLRKSDIACRYGGDEFVLVLPDSSSAAAYERLGQIRVLVKGLEVLYGRQVLGLINLSAGIAQSPQNGATADELLRSADEAMYAAKQAGGDRIVIYQRDTAH
jgi:diguanylate cyclase (GGDEF)-like protein/PAS domain S-box-containing protein